MFVNSTSRSHLVPKKALPTLLVAYTGNDSSTYHHLVSRPRLARKYRSDIPTRKSNRTIRPCLLRSIKPLARAFASAGDARGVSCRPLYCHSQGYAFQAWVTNLSCPHLNLICLQTATYISPSPNTAPVSMSPSSWVPACRVGGNLSTKQVLMSAHWRAILVFKALLSLSCLLSVRATVSVTFLFWPFFFFPRPSILSHARRLSSRFLGDTESACSTESHYPHYRATHPLSYRRKLSESALSRLIQNQGRVWTPPKALAAVTG
ncbi:hypothetical protein LY78DRAFT_56085 [Colletotrichum sublineola]|nr:hypothetical protein LY78DRAFT_56085 [Colletotrichum sublineola]